MANTRYLECIKQLTSNTFLQETEKLLGFTFVRRDTNINRGSVWFGKKLYGSTDFTSEDGSVEFTYKEDGSIDFSAKVSGENMTMDELTDMMKEVGILPTPRMIYYESDSEDDLTQAFGYNAEIVE